MTVVSQTPVSRTDWEEDNSSPMPWLRPAVVQGVLYDAISYHIHINIVESCLIELVIYGFWVGNSLQTVALLRAGLTLCKL